MHSLHVLLAILAVVVLFNAIIIVHELGHFLAARWRGLVVEQFGVWFGSPLWQKKIGGVVYSLGSIPAGGFVKLPQLAPMEAIEGQSATPREQLPAISALDKIIVAFAGPLFSFGLAVVLAWVVFFAGRPTAEMETSATIGYVLPGSPAEKAGLHAGDIIKKVDGHEVTSIGGIVNSVVSQVVRSEGETIAFEIERDGKTLAIDSGWVLGPHKRFGRAGMRQVQIAPAWLPKIEKVEPNTPAAATGLKPGDIITHLNGERIYSPEAVAAAIEKAPKAPLSLTIQRGGEWDNFTLQPALLPAEAGEAPRPRIGIQWAIPIRMVHPRPMEQIAASVTSIVDTVNALLSRKSNIGAQQLMGPVGIGKMYYGVLSGGPEGWRLALWLSVLINVNLAILNLLPFPVLDGGHITLAIIEAIRRKPVNVKFLEVLQNACVLLLFGFILYVTFFDVVDILPGQRVGGSPTPAPAQTEGGK